MSSLTRRGSVQEAEVQVRSALEGHMAPGIYGAAGAGPGVALQEQNPAGIAQIIAPPKASALKAILPVAGIKALPKNRRAVDGKHATVMWSGPGQWLVVFHPGQQEAEVLALAGSIEDSNVTVTNLSHARTVIRISGPQAVEVLLKGCPLDLESFDSNDCAASLLGHLNVQVHCIEKNCFDVYVFRSFGLALWEWLKDAALEYGVEIVETR